MCLGDGEGKGGGGGRGRKLGTPYRPSNQRAKGACSRARKEKGEGTWDLNKG